MNNYFKWKMSGCRTLLMGILNVTPDSFSDGGKYEYVEAALRRVREMVGEGADVIDIGAESTRPGAVELTAEEEWRRLEPVLEALKDTSLAIPISIDTYKASVAEKALAYGVSIVNDIWGLQGDSAMAGVVARSGAGLVVMHNRNGVLPGEVYSDMVRFLYRSLNIAEQAGIPLEKISIDPGVGFGKSYEQNLEVLQRLPDLRREFDLPILLGVSRKSVIGRTLDLSVEEREEGTLAISALAVEHGVQILRVHDVKANRRAVQMAESVRSRKSKDGSDRTHRDAIQLRGLSFHGFHGVLPNETRDGQCFLVDLDLYMNFAAAAQSDELNQTVDYAEVYNAVREIMEGDPVRLIEALAEMIAQRLLAKYAMIHSLRVRLHKPKAPLPGKFEDVSVEIQRERW